MTVSNPLKRARTDPLLSYRIDAQPLLDQLLGVPNSDFTVENVIAATKTANFRDLVITIDNGDAIVSQLDSMWGWLDLSKVESSKRQKTRSGTAPYRQALDDLDNKIWFAESTITYLREQRAIANRPVAPIGNRGDGNFYLTAIKMGQGDCTLITTPKGQVIMIDCGSDATETTDDDESEGTTETKEQYQSRIQGTIYSDKFLKNDGVISVLILTHADTDHYNKIPVMLKDTVRFQNVYHSGRISDYSAQGGAGKSIGSWITAHATRDNSVKAVSHNEESGIVEISINGVGASPQDDTNKIDHIDAGNGLCIVDEPNCKVSILASNVHQTFEDKYKNPINDQSNEKNRGSVVTLIEVFGKKILICGDATRNTEQYLINNHQDRIKNLTISQAPHHGSDNTSSGLAFVNVINPTEVLVSSGRKVKKDHLPSAATIVRYSRKMGRSAFAEIAEHRIFYWETTGSGGYTSQDEFIKRPISITGSWGTVEKSVPNPG